MGFTTSIYPNLGSVSTLTKWIIIFFQKIISFLKLEIIDFFHDLLSSEVIQSVAYDNYDDFQQVNFIFSQKFIPLFWGLFNDETDLRVRYTTMKYMNIHPYIANFYYIPNPTLWKDSYMLISLGA